MQFQLGKVESDKQIAVAEALRYKVGSHGDGTCSHGD